MSILMRLWGGSLTASRFSICWIAFFATDSEKWPSSTSSLRPLFKGGGLFRRFGNDSIVILEHMAFRDNEDLYQSLVEAMVSSRYRSCSVSKPFLNA
ncbi:unnamed protein product [Prunus armeniaca]